MSTKPPTSRADFKVWRTITTRWADNDAYGHVNNTVYYAWFDSAVNAWLVDQGLLYVREGDPIALVVGTHCTYAAALSFPQDVEVGLAVAHLGRSSMRYRIGVFAKESETAAAEGEFVHVMVDRTTRRPVAIPESWRSALETIQF